jgi:hypothetical protein
VFLMNVHVEVRPEADGPFHFDVDPAAQIVTLRYTEPATFERFATTLDTVVTHPEYKRGFHILIDHRRVHRAPTVAYVESVLAYMQQHRADFHAARWAVLIDPNDPAVGGMARMLAFRADLRIGIQIDVFQDEAQARTWLREASR